MKAESRRIDKNERTGVRWRSNPRVPVRVEPDKARRPGELAGFYILTQRLCDFTVSEKCDLQNNAVYIGMAWPDELCLQTRRRCRGVRLLHGGLGRAIVILGWISHDAECRQKGKKAMEK